MTITETQSLDLEDIQEVTQADILNNSTQIETIMQDIQAQEKDLLQQTVMQDSERLSYAGSILSGATTALTSHLLKNHEAYTIVTRERNGALTRLVRRGVGASVVDSQTLQACRKGRISNATADSYLGDLSKYQDSFFHENPGVASMMNAEASTSKTLSDISTRLAENPLSITQPLQELKTVDARFAMDVIPDLIKLQETLNPVLTEERIRCNTLAERITRIEAEATQKATEGTPLTEKEITKAMNAKEFTLSRSQKATIARGGLIEIDNVAAAERYETARKAGISGEALVRITEGDFKPSKYEMNAYADISAYKSYLQGKSELLNPPKLTSMDTLKQLRADTLIRNMERMINNPQEVFEGRRLQNADYPLTIEQKESILNGEDIIVTDELAEKRYKTAREGGFKGQDLIDITEGSFELTPEERKVFNQSPEQLRRQLLWQKAEISRAASIPELNQIFDYKPIPEQVKKPVQALSSKMSSHVSGIQATYRDLQLLRPLNEAVKRANLEPLMGVKDLPANVQRVCDEFRMVESTPLEAKKSAKNSGTIQDLLSPRKKTATEAMQAEQTRSGQATSSETTMRKISPKRLAIGVAGYGASAALLISAIHSTNQRAFPEKALVDQLIADTFDKTEKYMTGYNPCIDSYDTQAKKDLLARAKKYASPDELELLEAIEKCEYDYGNYLIETGNLELFAVAPTDQTDSGTTASTQQDGMFSRILSGEKATPSSLLAQKVSPYFNAMLKDYANNRFFSELEKSCQQREAEREATQNQAGEQTQSMQDESRQPMTRQTLSQNAQPYRDNETQGNDYMYTEHTRDM